MATRAAAPAITLAFAFSVMCYFPIPAQAQEGMPGAGISMQVPNGTNPFHSPCFPGGLHGHRMHGGQHGNWTGHTRYSSGSRAAWMGNGTHHWQPGNHTGFRMPPCPQQVPANAVNPNSTTITQSAAQISSTTTPIPSWVRNNAKWWSEGKMGDSDFIQGMQYLIQQGIMKIPQTAENRTAQSQAIPAWVKTSASWWSQGQISDDDFLKGIEYLVSSGIVKV